MEYPQVEQTLNSLVEKQERVVIKKKKVLCYTENTSTKLSILTLNPDFLIKDIITQNTQHPLWFGAVLKLTGPLVSTENVNPFKSIYFIDLLLRHR